MSTPASSIQLGQRRSRNRKRSKRRGIYCLEHGCYLDSASPKRSIYADRPEHLQKQGLSRKKASMLIAQKTTVTLSEEWLEAFWCGQCYETKWYHVQRDVEGNYSLSVATRELWHRAQGVIDPYGNPSVGEFSRRHACMSAAYHALQKTQSTEY